MAQSKKKNTFDQAYLTVSALASYLGYSKSYIYQNWQQFALKNKIRVYRFRKKVLFNRDDVDQAMKKYVVSK